MVQNQIYKATYPSSYFGAIEKTWKFQMEPKLCLPLHQDLIFFTQLKIMIEIQSSTKYVLKIEEV